MIRRWIKLIFADWLPAFHLSVVGAASLLDRRSTLRCSQKNLEDSPHRARRRVTDHSRIDVVCCVTVSCCSESESIQRVRGRHLPGDIPDEAGTARVRLRRRSCSDERRGPASRRKRGTKSQLRFPCDVDDRVAVSPSSRGRNAIRRGERKAVIPRGFDRELAGHACCRSW